MPSPLLGRALLCVSATLLAHAGFSGLHYKALVRERYGDVKPELPLDVLLECVVAFALCLCGAALLAEGFKPVYVSDEAPLNSFHRLFGPRTDVARMPRAAKALADTTAAAAAPVARIPAA